MFHWWKHSWITWRRKESLRLARETIGLPLRTHSSDMFNPRNRHACFSARRSSRFLCDGTLVQRSDTFRRKNCEILAQPDLRTSEGRRDAVLLSVLYDTGARVQ